MSCGRPVWAEINLAAIGHNMAEIKGLLKPGTRFCAVIKADGYGHGAVALAGEAVKAGADYLAVAILDEALQLRAAGFTQPILILGFTPPAQARQVAARGLTQTIYTLSQAQALSEAATAEGLTAKVHLKIDSGMGRLGVAPAEAADLALAVSACPNIMIEGVYTHFAAADSDDKAYTQKQFTAFKAAADEIKKRGLAVPIVHCANSAATLDLPEMHLDMIRAGIVLYGLWPSEETTRPVTLKPAMRLMANMAFIKDVPAGTSLSYGCTFTTEKPSRIATLPLGYADGWTRMLSGKAQVAVAGQRAPVVGRICMDQCMIDLSELSGVTEKDPVLLFGGPELPVEEVAASLNTINYEIVCMVGKRVPRVYIRR